MSKTSERWQYIRAHKVRAIIGVGFLILVIIIGATIGNSMSDNTASLGAAASAGAGPTSSITPARPPTFTMPAGARTSTAQQNAAAAAVLAQCDRWYRDQLATGEGLVGQQQIDWWLSTRIGVDATPELNAYRMAESVYPATPPDSLTTWADDMNAVPGLITTWYNETDPATQKTDLNAVTKAIDTADSATAALKTGR